MGARKRGASFPELATLTVGMAALVSVLVLLLGAPAARAAEGAGAIAGTVTAAASPHEPLRGISVTVYEAEGPQAPAGFATTNASGEYEVKGLRAGSYKVEFSAEGTANYVTQFYREAATLASASRVAVVEASTTHEIDAELLAGGKIAGTVTEAEGGAALNGVEVRAIVFEAGTARTVGYAATDAGGHYTVEGLESGSYYVDFSPGFEGFPGGEGFEEEGPLFPEGVSGRNLVGQLYRGAADFADATLVHVAREASTEGIDAQLQRGGEIEGTVTDSYTHAPIQGVWVTALGPGEALAAFVTTDRNGHYVLAGLESGSYTVSFEAPRYIAQFYSDKPSWALADPIAVTRPLVSAGIDAALVPKAPANTAAPVASGTPAVGQTLSCTQGIWTGSPAPTYSYAWLRDGAPIPGANATTYTVQGADQGNGVTCRVTATNRNGSAAATSNTLIVPVLSLPPPLPPTLHIETSHASVRGGAVRVALQCIGPRCQGILKLVERIPVKHRHHRTSHKTVIVAEASYLVQAGQTATVTVELNGKGRHALAHALRHRLQTELLATVAGGPNARHVLLLSAMRHR